MKTVMVSAVAALMFAGLQPAIAQSGSKGASDAAPGQRQTAPGTAKRYAPGQKQTAPGTAKKYAPGQKQRTGSTTKRGGSSSTGSGSGTQ